MAARHVGRPGATGGAPALNAAQRGPTAAITQLAGGHKACPYVIPAGAGMTVSLTRGGAGKMLAEKARISDLAMQAFCLQFCRLEAGVTF